MTKKIKDWNQIENWIPHDLLLNQKNMKQEL